MNQYLFDEQCVRYVISGRVQGVSYRKSVEKFVRLQNLAIRGDIRNLPDGNVEVRAIGQSSDLKILEQYLWSGPILARVDKVAIVLVNNELDKKKWKEFFEQNPFAISYEDSMEQD